MHRFREEVVARAGLVCLLVFGSALSLVRAAPAPFAGRPQRATAELLAALDRNAAWAGGLMRGRVDVEVCQGPGAIGMAGTLAFDRSGRYRLRVSVLGRPAGDLGSNGRESWCRFRGRDWSRVVPFRPDWLPALLGLGTSRRAGDYTAIPRKGGVDLVEKTALPNGTVVRKVLVIERAGTKARVAGLRVEGDRGRVILTGSVTRFERDPETGRDRPAGLRLACPGERVEVVVRRHGLEAVGAAAGDQARRVFAPPPRQGKR